MKSPKSAPAGQSRGAFRDGILVALSNPKSLIYIVALLPPFVDARQPIGPQLAVLAAMAIAIDLAVGAIYIAAGSRLAATLTHTAIRKRFDRAIGILFVLIAAGILGDIASR